MSMPATAVSVSTASRTRWVALTFIFVLSLVAYVDRSNISVSTSTILKALHITPVQMGLISSLFSAAYAIVQLPGSAFVKKLGSRKSVAWIVLLWSFFTVLTGLAGGFISLLIVRMFFGFSEAPLFPGLNQHILHWFPVKERGFSNALKTAGTYAASIVTPPVTVWVLLTLNWHWVFVLSGILGIIVCLLWYKLSRDDPSEHAGVNQLELQYIKSGMDTRIEGAKTPWRALFTSRSFWGIGLTFFCSLYVIQFFLYWLPYYLQHQLHMSIKSMGFAASVPWVFIFVAALFAGKLTDALFKANAPLFVARNVVIMCGFALAAVFMFIGTLMHGPWAVVFMLSIGLGFAGFTGTIPWAIATDIGGEHTATVSGWMNMWGFAAATIMPTVSAVIGEHYSWNDSVLMLVFVALLGVLATLMIKPSKKIGGSSSAQRINVQA